MYERKLNIFDNLKRQFSNFYYFYFDALEGLNLKIFRKIRKKMGEYKSMLIREERK